MILLDSSGWIEILVDGPLARQFEPYIRVPEHLILSTINLFEVYKKIARTAEEDALRAIAIMRAGQVIPVDETVSIEAGDLSLKYGLAMADSLILATAQLHSATLVTKDVDFAKIPGCKVIS